MRGAIPDAADDADLDLLELISAPIWVTACDGRVLRVNSAAAAMLGYDAAALARFTMGELTHPGDQADRLRQQEELRATGALVARRRIRHRDGHYLLVEGRARLDARGRIVTVVEDVSALESTRRALADSEREFSAIFGLSATGKVQADAGTLRFLRVNAKFCEITGYTEAELLGKTFTACPWAARSTSTARTSPP